MLSTGTDLSSPVIYISKIQQNAKVSLKILFTFTQSIFFLIKYSCTVIELSPCSRHALFCFHAVILRKTYGAGRGAIYQGNAVYASTSMYKVRLTLCVGEGLSGSLNSDCILPFMYLNAAEDTVPFWLLALIRWASDG